MKQIVITDSSGVRHCVPNYKVSTDTNNNNSILDLNKNYGWKNKYSSSSQTTEFGTNDVFVRTLGNAWTFEKNTFFSYYGNVAKCELNTGSTGVTSAGMFIQFFDLQTIEDLTNLGKEIVVFVELNTKKNYRLQLYVGSTKIEDSNVVTFGGGNVSHKFNSFPASSVPTNDSGRCIRINLMCSDGETVVGRIHFAVIDAGEQVGLPCGLITTSKNSILETRKEIGGSADDILVSNNTELVRDYFIQSTKGGNLNLLWFSDIHGDGVNYERIKRFKKFFNKYIDSSIHTGDIVSANSTNDFTFWNDETILNCIGNHDVKDGSNNDTLTEIQCYDKYFSPFISNWGATYTSGKCYYYKDFSSKNIRLIVLDIMHSSDAQNSFLIDSLAGAKDNGYHVLIAQHYPIGINMNYKRNSAWCSAYQVSTNAIPSAWTSAVDSFKNSGGKFIAWLNGHTHFDIYSTMNDQLNLTVGTANKLNSADSDYYRRTNEKSQDLFNIVSIDTAHCIISMWRIGADRDKFNRLHTTFSYNYDSNEELM